MDSEAKFSPENMETALLSVWGAPWWSGLLPGPRWPTGLAAHAPGAGGRSARWPGVGPTPESMVVGGARSDPEEHGHGRSFLLTRVSQRRHVKKTSRGCWVPHVVWHTQPGFPCRILYEPRVAWTAWLTWGPRRALPSAGARGVSRGEAMRSRSPHPAPRCSGSPRAAGAPDITLISPFLFSWRLSCGLGSSQPLLPCPSPEINKIYVLKGKIPPKHVIVSLSSGLTACSLHRVFEGPGHLEQAHGRGLRMGSVSP